MTYRVAEGIKIFYSDTAEAPATTELGGIFKFTGLPGVTVKTFDVTPESKADPEVRHGMNVGVSLFDQFSEITFGLNGDWDTLQAAHDMRGEPRYFEIRYPDGAKDSGVGIITRAQDENDGGNLITNTTITPDGDWVRTPPV